MSGREWFVELLGGWVQSRRAARRTVWAVAHLRQESARARKDGDRNLARYLSSLADVIEATP